MPIPLDYKHAKKNSTRKAMLCSLLVADVRPPLGQPGQAVAGHHQHVVTPLSLTAPMGFDSPPTSAGAEHKADAISDLDERTACRMAGGTGRAYRI